MDRLSDAEIDKRVLRSRQGLASWRRESTANGADRALLDAAAATEIGVLCELSEIAPEHKRAKIAALIDTHEEFRRTLVPLSTVS